MSHDLNAIDWTTLLPLIIDLISGCLDPTASIDEMKEVAEDQPMRAHMVVRRALRQQGYRGHDLRKLAIDVTEHLKSRNESELYAMMRGDQS